MSRPLTTLGNRLRTRTISLPTINRTQRPFSFDAGTSKARAAQWEPNLPSLDALLPTKQQQDDVDGQDGGEKDQDDQMPMMTTYSAFDPGSSRPLMLHSSMGVPVPSIADVYLRDVVPGRGRGRVTTVEKDMAIKDKVVTTTTTTTAVTLPSKPWPYRLPAFLQPGVGTTFEMMHRTTTTVTPTTSAAAPAPATAPTSHESRMHGCEKAPQRIRISILQAMLYDISEPENFSFAKTVVRDGGVLHKILYGVKDHEGAFSGEVGVDVAVSEVVGVAETKTTGEEAQVVVLEKKEKVEEVAVVKEVFVMGK